uniref:acyltransferase family protein n=1 Tax=Roseovarius indicus TaxID=540747 RepID=UPI003B521E0B
MKYRREIDGLRAVAVLPVILFHAGMTFWSGGFVGVDVFFVISGYLITSILIDDRERGTYSVLKFYERRARRILPALFIVLIACIPFAWMWVPPYPFEDFARSLAFAALFISNVHFLEHGGYFDLNADLRPLLHTWSLAVEEQYYLLFPLVLFCLRKFRRAKFLIVFTLLALASLAVAEWGWRNYPSQNFYFTPSRLWELLAGSLCAVILYQRAQLKSEILAGLGLAMILFATVFFNAALPFPSLYTLVPVVGTCLIILFAERETVTARILSIKPFVGVGLISYSAYLWHQPIFAFARIRHAEEVPDWAMMLLAGLALVLAWVSWRFIEQPFRGKAPLVLPTRRGILGASFAGIVVFAAFGFWGLAKEGFPSRIDFDGSPYLARLYEQTTEHGAAEGLCPEASSPVLRDLCPAYAAETPERRIALMGDSHSRVMLPAFEPASEELDATILLGDKPGCPPLLGVHLASGGGDARICRQAVERFAQQVRETDVDTVVLIARWSLYVSGDYDGIDPRSQLVPEAGARFMSDADHVAAFENGLRETFDYFREAGIRVIVFSQVPQQRIIPGILVQNAMLLGLDEAAARRRFEESFVTREASDRLQARARGIMAEVTSVYDIPVLTLDDVFVDGDRFAWLDGADSLYMDDDHVSEIGAARLAPLVLEALSRPAQ